jgi:hypothetical protein
MGKILPSYKKALLDELFDNISSNTSYYYAFAANPVGYVSSAPEVANNDYESTFEFDWQMIFGKRLISSNFAPVIKNNQWLENTIYDMYDNTDDTLHDKNNFYVITPPNYTGGSYNIYKCLDNANNSPSTVKPDIIQTTTFETSDGYKWRYLSSISYRQYITFSTDKFCPVYSNTIISKYSNTYAGVDIVNISNGGSGYIAYTNGIVKSANSTVIQIDNLAVDQSEYYTNSAIYIYNSTASTSQLFGIQQYVSNTIGRWVYLDGEANTDNILPDSTQYKISPRVVFNSDGDIMPKAYSVVNTSTNSISNIVMLDIGSDITWANVYITSNFGSGANLYAIVPPPGGHGKDIISELNVQGFSVAFNFSNTENSTIPTSNSLYNKIGIIKNPYSLLANTAKGSAYTANTFKQLSILNLSSPVQFSNGGMIFANNSSVSGVEPSYALGTIVLADTSQIQVTGDKYFKSGDIISSSDGTLTSAITVVDNGDIYVKDLTPIYVDNINNVNRSSNQTESFKLIIQI